MGDFMRLDEAKQILKENGFLCEEVKADLNHLKPGDEFLLFTQSSYGDYPKGKLTLIEPDEDVKPSVRAKNKAWICELEEVEQEPAEFYIGQKHAFTHGTYGDAIVYPVVRFEHKYKLSGKKKKESVYFMWEEVLFKNDKKNFVKGKWHNYFITDLENLDNGKKTWGSSNNVITNEKELAEIFAEHPELKKEYDEFETKYYNLRK
jgi:hypothetical protein